MDFLDRARAAQERVGPPCSVSTAISAMEPTYAAGVRAALADSTIRATTICRILGEDGITIQPQTVLRHRRRILGTAGDTCSCPA